MPRRKVPDPFALKLGRRINALRVEREMSLRQLSQESGVSKGQLSSVEHGLVVLSVVTVAKIARGLGMTLMTLMTFPEESPIEALVEHMRDMSPAQLVKLVKRIRSKTAGIIPEGT